MERRSFCGSGRKGKATVGKEKGNELEETGFKGALVMWAFNLIAGFPGGWVQYIRGIDSAWEVGEKGESRMDSRLGRNLRLVRFWKDFEVPCCG